MIKETLIDALVGLFLFFSLPLALVAALFWQLLEWSYGKLNRA